MSMKRSPLFHRPDPAVLRLLLFFGALIAVLVVLLAFRRLFLPLILGFAVAYLFAPAVAWFERRGRSRLLGVAVITLGLLVALAGFFLYVVPQTGDQIEKLADSFPAYRAKVEAQIKPWLTQMRARYPEQFAEAQERAVTAAKDAMPQIAQRIGRWIGNIFQDFLAAVLFLLNLIFVPVFAFYLLMDYPHIRQGTKEMIPVPYRATSVARVREVDRALSSFVRGQFTIALILATINAIGLMLLGVPLGLVIGIVAGLANMIPYMAILIGLAPALLLSWVEDQSIAKLIGVVAVFVGAQMLEGTVLSPRILGKSVNLHPVWVLLSIIVFGSWFGFFGMLIAVPLAAVLQVFIRHWLTSYRESRVYLGGVDFSREEAEETPSMP
jgi:predicted PurR-regulated permease PerM